MALLPTDALRRLKAANENARLPHALLVTGPVASELETFAHDLSALLLEHEKNALSTHPDFHLVRPESKSRRILIDQMRQLEGDLSTKPVAGKKKIAVIQDADRLMEQAANAFLKTLEEPPPDTIILLTSTLPDALLATILSRCVQISLRTASRPPPTQKEQAVKEIAVQLLASQPHAEISEVFLGVRKFQNLLKDIREESEKRTQALLKEQKSHYKDRVDLTGKWLEDEEGRLQALSESHAVRERAALLDALLAVFCERLKKEAEAGDPRISRSQSLRLLRQIDAVNTLRSDLEKNLHEPLALEAGFLEIFVKS